MPAAAQQPWWLMAQAVHPGVHPWDAVHPTAAPHVGGHHEPTRRSFDTGSSTCNAPGHGLKHHGGRQRRIVHPRRVGVPSFCSYMLRLYPLGELVVAASSTTIFGEYSARAKVLSLQPPQR